MQCSAVHKEESRDKGQPVVLHKILRSAPRTSKLMAPLRSWRLPHSILLPTHRCCLATGPLSPHAAVTDPAPIRCSPILSQRSSTTDWPCSPLLRTARSQRDRRSMTTFKSMLCPLSAMSCRMARTRSRGKPMDTTSSTTRSRVMVWGPEGVEGCSAGKGGGGRWGRGGGGWGVLLRAGCWLLREGREARRRASGGCRQLDRLCRQQACALHPPQCPPRAPRRQHPSPARRPKPTRALTAEEEDEKVRWGWEGAREGGGAWRP